MSIKNKFFLVIFGIFLSFLLLEISLQLLAFLNLKVHSRKHPAIESKGIYVIACFGDSFTYGMSAGIENSYPSQLEKILENKQLKQKFKVYNFGVPGINSSETLRNMQENIKKIRPDIAIVLTGDNDDTNFKHIELETIPLLLKAHSRLQSFRTYRLLTLFFNNKYKADLKKNVNLLIREGNSCRYIGDFKKAKFYYDKALIIQPQNTTALLELGRFYRIKAQYDEAIKVLTTAFRIDPNNAPIIVELVDVFININEPKKAKNYFIELSKEFPNNEDLHKLVSTYTRLEKDLSLVNKNKAIKLIPQTKLSFKNSYVDNYIASQLLYRNLIKIVQLCRENKIVLIFSSYPHNTSFVMEKVAKIYGIPLINQASVFNKLLKNSSDDKYFVSTYDHHCTKYGYRIMAENIAEKIIKIFN